MSTIPQIGTLQLTASNMLPEKSIGRAMPPSAGSALGGIGAGLLAANPMGAAIGAVAGLAQTALQDGMQPMFQDGKNDARGMFDFAGTFGGNKFFSISPNVKGVQTVRPETDFGIEFRRSGGQSFTDFPEPLKANRSAVMNSSLYWIAAIGVGAALLVYVLKK